MQYTKLILVLIFSLLLFSCNSKTKDREVQEKPKSQEQVKAEAKDTHIYKSKLIEELREKMLEFTDAKSVEISDSENLIFEGKNYYFIKINDTEKYSYLINYSGFNVEGMLLRVNKVEEDNMKMIEKLAVILIQLSDDRIDEAHARAVYIDLLVKLGDNTGSKVTLENGINYGISVNKKEELVFLIQ